MATLASQAETMPRSGADTGRWLRLALVVLAFVLLLYGGATLASMGFFGVMTRPSGDIVEFYATQAGTLRTALSAMLFGYLLVVPVMAMVTRHVQGENRDSRFGGLALGLLWASLALRPLWWAAHVVLLPSVVALGAPGTDPAEGAAFMSAFRVMDTVLNTATEDIGVNVLGGAWFVLIGREMLRQDGRMPALGAVTVLLGALFLVSSAELLGLSLGESGGIVPLIVSVAGPFWLLFVGGAVALRGR